MLGGALLTANLRQPVAPTRPTEVSAPTQKGLGVPAPAWTREADRAAHQARLDQYTQLMARLEAMPLPEDVRAKLLPFARSTGALVADHGPAKAIQALRELQVYVDYTEAQLQLHIPDGAGEISGYERCRKTSACQPGSEDGKAWFLVFQARDPQGKVVTMPLANGHTGAIALTDSLGVQVTHAQYLKAQQVKQAKGRVDNPVIGRKDAYNLSRHFDNRVFAGSSFDNPADTNQSIVSASF